MEKREEFNQALKDAMKSKDETAVGTLRLILAALKDRDIAARGTGKSVGEPEILAMLQGMIKQRNESLKIFRDAKREDLASKEEAEIKIIERFMPKQLGEAEMADIVENLIVETGAKDVKDMGRVMAELKNCYAGQLDMAKAGALVRQKLS